MRHGVCVCRELLDNRCFERTQRAAEKKEKFIDFPRVFKKKQRGVGKRIQGYVRSCGTDKKWIEGGGRVPGVKVVYYQLSHQRTAVQHGHVCGPCTLLTTVVTRLTIVIYQLWLVEPQSDSASFPHQLHACNHFETPLDEATTSKLTSTTFIIRFTERADLKGSEANQRYAAKDCTAILRSSKHESR